MLEKNIEFSKKFLFINLSLIVGFTFQNIGYFLPNIANKPFRTFIDGMSEWINVNYFEFGFIRRAFIGTFLSFLNNSALRELLYVLITLLIIFTTLYIIFRRFFEFDRVFYNFIIVLFTLSPLGAIQIGYTFGRFEHINFLIIILAINMIEKNKYLFASLALLCGILIHEAFFIYGLPLVFTYALEKFNNFDIKKLSILFIPAILITIFLAFFGNSEKALLMSAVGAKRGFFITRSLVESDIAIFFYVYLIIVNHIYILRRLELQFNLLDLTPYCSLSLFFFGIDFARWIGILFFIVILSIYTRLKNVKPYKDYKFNFNASYIFLAFPLLGPIGVIYAYPIITNFFQLINKFS